MTQLRNVQVVLNITRDWWCERRMWQAAGASTGPIAEPACAATGVVMVVFALIPNADSSARLPLLFLFFKACLVVLGLGTVVFHGFEYGSSLDAHLNLNMFDWAPVVLTVSVLTAVYLAPAMHKLENYAAVLAYIAFALWCLFLVVAMDTSTYSVLEGAQWGTIMNGVLLAPPLVVLAVFTALRIGWRAWVLWLLLTVGLAAWLVNYYACSFWSPLALLHAVYHLVITYALILAGCLGLTAGGEWEMDDSSAWARVRAVQGYSAVKSV